MGTVLTIIGVLLVTMAGVPYISAIIRGRVRPKLISWGIWTVLGVLTTLAALGESQIPSALVSAVAAVTCLTVVVLGWSRGSRRITRLDVVCLIGALAGLVVYFAARDPFLALAVSVTVDAIAFVPTLAHGWTDPDEESLSSFVYIVAGQGFVVAAALIGGATITGLLYPLYSLTFNGAMAYVLFSAKFSLRSKIEDYRGEEV